MALLPDWHPSRSEDPAVRAVWESTQYILIPQTRFELDLSHATEYAYAERASEHPLYAVYNTIMTHACATVEHPEWSRATILPNPQAFYGEHSPPRGGVFFIDPALLDSSRGDNADPAESKAEAGAETHREESSATPEPDVAATHPQDSHNVPDALVSTGDGPELASSSTYPTRIPDFARLIIFHQHPDSDSPTPEASDGSDSQERQSPVIIDFWEVKPLNSRDQWGTPQAKENAQPAIKAHLNQVYETAMAAFNHHPALKEVTALLLIGVYFSQFVWSRPAAQPGTARPAVGRDFTVPSTVPSTAPSATLQPAVRYDDPGSSQPRPPVTPGAQGTRLSLLPVTPNNHEARASSSHHPAIPGVSSSVPVIPGLLPSWPRPPVTPGAQGAKSNRPPVTPDNALGSLLAPWPRPPATPNIQGSTRPSPVTPDRAQGARASHPVTSPDIRTSVVPPDGDSDATPRAAPRLQDNSAPSSTAELGPAFVGKALTPAQRRKLLEEIEADERDYAHLIKTLEEEREAIIARPLPNIYYYNRLAVDFHYDSQERRMKVALSQDFLNAIAWPLAKFGLTHQPAWFRGEKAQMPSIDRIGQQNVRMNMHDVAQHDEVIQEFLSDLRKTLEFKGQLNDANWRFSLSPDPGESDSPYKPPPFPGYAPNDRDTPTPRSPPQRRRRYPRTAHYTVTSKKPVTYARMKANREKAHARRRADEEERERQGADSDAATWVTDSTSSGDEGGPVTSNNH